MVVELDASPSRRTTNYPTKLAVYQLYKEEMGNKPGLTRTHFVFHTCMWKKQLSNVYIPKV